MPFAARLSATIEETCQATGLGRTRIYEMIKAGRIETSMEGTRRLILVRSIVKLIDPAYIPAYIPAADTSGQHPNSYGRNADEKQPDGRLSKHKSKQLQSPSTP